MPRAKTPAQAFLEYETKEKRRKLEAKRVITGKQPEPFVSRGRRDGYGQPGEDPRQLNIFDAITARDQEQRYADLQILGQRQSAARPAESEEQEGAGPQVQQVANA